MDRFVFIALPILMGVYTYWTIIAVREKPGKVRTVFTGLAVLAAVLVMRGLIFVIMEF